MAIILDKIQTINNTYSFTHVYYQISNYIINHLNEVKSMTLNSLATYSCTSRSSVLKFCGDMGFTSWKLFSTHLINEIEQRKSMNKIIEMNVKTTLDTEDEEMSISKNQLDYFQEYYNCISYQILKKVSDDLKQAKRILICGEDNVCLCLREFQTFLSFQGKEVMIRSMVNKKDIDKLVEQFEMNDIIFIITPSESFESLLERHEFDDILQFHQLINKPTKKVFIGQKNILNIQYLGCQFISIPYTIDYYLYNFVVLDFIHKLSNLYLKTNSNHK